MFCENRTKTKYRCITCNVPACNMCTSFEKDEEVDGWRAGKSVGYCRDCLNFPINTKNTHYKLNLNHNDIEEDGELEGGTYSSSTRSERSQEAKSRFVLRTRFIEIIIYRH